MGDDLGFTSSDFVAFPGRPQLSLRSGWEMEWKKVQGVGGLKGGGAVFGMQNKIVLKINLKINRKNKSGKNLASFYFIKISRDLVEYCVNFFDVID